MEARMYQPIFISYPSYEEQGPVFPTHEEAERWLNRQIMYSGRRDDWGYVIEVAPVRNA